MKMTCEQFNERYPVGSKLFFRATPGAKSRRVTILQESEEIAEGLVLVKVSGRSARAGISDLYKSPASLVPVSEVDECATTSQCGERVFVNRNKWSHENKRKKYKKLFKGDKVRLVFEDDEGCLYEHL